jgi:hypothetical protein
LPFTQWATAFADERDFAADHARSAAAPCAHLADRERELSAGEKKVKTVMIRKAAGDRELEAVL